MSYIRSMIECLKSNRMLLQEELEHLEHYPELVRCSRPNCAACAAGYFHGPNAYYQYYEDGQLKEKYLGKKIREEYIRKTEANKKYGAVAAEIRTLEEEIAQLEALLPQKGREKG